MQLPLKSAILNSMISSTTGKGIHHSFRFSSGSSEKGAQFNHRIGAQRVNCVCVKPQERLEVAQSGSLPSTSVNSVGVWASGDRSTVSPAQLLLGPWGFHGHASTDHCWITPVPPHSIWPKRGAGSPQPTQRPQDGAGTHCSAP